MARYDCIIIATWVKYRPSWTPYSQSRWGQPCIICLMGHEESAHKFKAADRHSHGLWIAQSVRKLIFYSFNNFINPQWSPSLLVCSCHCRIGAGIAARGHPATYSPVSWGGGVYSCPVGRVPAEYLEISETPSPRWMEVCLTLPTLLRGMEIGQQRREEEEGDDAPAS